MTLSTSFFGTDGIRGLVQLQPVDEDEAIRLIEEERTLTPAFMRLVGESLSYTQPGLPGKGETVVVGWDRRPGNPALVEALTLGLRLTGSPCRPHRRVRHTDPPPSRVVVWGTHGMHDHRQPQPRLGFRNQSLRCVWLQVQSGVRTRRQPNRSPTGGGRSGRGRHRPASPVNARRSTA